MDRRVKERLVGATILLMLVVLIVPELLSGPRRPSGEPPASRGLPSQTVTVEVHTHATTREPAQNVVAAAMPVPADAATPAALVPIAAPPADAASLETRSAAQMPTGVAAAAAAPAAAPATALGVAAAAWAVQVGSFEKEANSDKLVRELKGEGYVVYVSSSGSGTAARYRVRIGPLADRDAAERAIAKLKAHGHAASIVPPAP